MKPGWKTTEFWLVVVANALTIVQALQAQLKPETAALIVSILNGIYAVLRTAGKQRGGTKDEKDRDVAGPVGPGNPGAGG